MRNFAFRVLSLLSAVPVLIFTWPWIRYYLIRAGIVLAVLIAAIIILHRICARRRRKRIERYYSEIGRRAVSNPTISMKRRNHNGF